MCIGIVVMVLLCVMVGIGDLFMFRFLWYFCLWMETSVFANIGLTYGAYMVIGFVNGFLFFGGGV